MRTNRPRASYELTRDCACSGISRWKTVNQSEVNGNPCTAEEARGRDRPDRRRGGKEQRLKHHRQWSDARYEQWPRRPDSHGDDAADDGADSARCEDGGPRTRPAEVIAAMSGPSTNGEVNVRLPIPKEDTVDHSQVCAVNSVQPSRSSRKKLRPALCAAGHDDPREEPGAREEREGVDSQRRSGLPATTSTPPSTGPRTPTTLRETPWRASPAAAAPG